MAQIKFSGGIIINNVHVDSMSLYYLTLKLCSVYFFLHCCSSSHIFMARRMYGTSKSFYCYQNASLQTRTNCMQYKARVNYNSLRMTGITTCNSSTIT